VVVAARTDAALGSERKRARRLFTEITGDVKLEIDPGKCRCLPGRT